MKHFLKNILIIDRERYGQRVGGLLRESGSSRFRLASSVIISMDIVLVEEAAGYWVEKNRFGVDGYWFPKERLPEFLLDPSKNYERTRLDDYGIVERVPSFVEGECTCHIAPPCSFCTSMTEEEANIFASGGLDALRRYRNGLTESLT